MELLAGSTVVASVGLSPSAVTDAFAQFTLTYLATTGDHGIPIAVQFRTPPRFQGGARAMLVDEVALSHDLNPVAVGSSSWGRVKNLFGSDSS